MKHLLQLVFAACILAVIVFGFYLTGSPSENRTYRRDEVRVADLGTLRDAVNWYRREEKQAPTSLDSILQNCTGKTGYRCSRLQNMNMDDFEYSVTGEKTFQLCATFERAAPFLRGNERNATRPSDHNAGRQCYDYNFRKR